MGNISPSLSQGQEVELENFPKGQAFKFDSLSGFTLFFFQQSPCQLPDGLFDLEKKKTNPFLPCAEQSDEDSEYLSKISAVFIFPFFPSQIQLSHTSN